MTFLLDKLTQAVTQKPRLVAIVVIALALIAGMGYRFDRSPWQTFLADRNDDEQLSPKERLDRYYDEFGLSDYECMLIIEGDDLLSRDNVSRVRSIVSALKELDQVEEVVWIDDVPMLNVFGLADPLLPPPDASESSYASARDRILDHPLIVEQIVARDGRTMMLPIKIRWLSVESDHDVDGGLLVAAQESIDDDPGNLRLSLTGDAPLYLAQLEAYRRNQRKFQFISYGLVFALSAFLFRGIVPILIVGAAPMLAIFVTFGVLRWVGAESNPLTDAVLPVLLALLGVTDGVHMMVHLRRCRAAGCTNSESVVEAMREVGSACVMTSLTTAVGFGSLMVAESEFVQQFGRACAFGVLVALAMVLTVIPLLTLSPLGNRLHRGLERDIVARNIGKLSWLISGVIRHHRVISVVAIALTLILAVVGLQMRPDSRLSTSLPDRSAAYQSLRVADRELGGIETVHVVVAWDPSISSDAPDVYEAVQDVQQIIDDEPLLSNSISIVDVLQTLPGEDGDAAQGMRMLDLLPARLRDRFLQRESRRAIVVFRAQDRGVGKYRDVFERIERELEDAMVEREGFDVELTGDVVFRSREIYQIVEDLARSLAVATGIIMILIGVSFRSARFAAISLVPNLFPLASTAFLIVLSGQPLNVSTVCAFTVCLGIAVDDSIHFLNRYTRLVRTGMSRAAAAKASFEQVGVALIMTTLVLLVGFGTVMTSELPSQRTFATMACGTIGAALFADLIFLPALLVWLDRRRGQATYDSGDPTHDSENEMVAN